jgi:hypothetical protein
MMHDNGTAFSSLLFYSHNVARALKASSDGELAHAIHETLHFALDGEPQDYYLPNDTPSKNHTGGSGKGEESEASTSTLSQNGQDGDSVDDIDRIRPGFFECDDEERPFISYEWEEPTRTLILPHPKTVLNPIIQDPCTPILPGAGVRDAFDVTAKFFFLGRREESSHEDHIESYSSEWVEEALKRFTTATGLDSVDTLILAFGETEERGTTKTEDYDDKVEKIVSLWKHLSPNEQILSMGLSDFSKRGLEKVVEKLQLGDCDAETEQAIGSKSSMTSQVQESLMKNEVTAATREGNTEATHVHIPSSPSRASFTGLKGDKERKASKEFGPGPCRRPRLCAINLKEQAQGANGSRNSSQPQPSYQSNGKPIGSCCWDHSLAEYCKDNSILLVAHSDRKGESKQSQGQGQLYFCRVLSY